MTKPLEKGNELENAVKAIEHVILQSSPGLEENTFRIESKKILNIEGVRHEIDIWVEIDHGKDYRSIYIFECKNWKDSVGKNEIIIFSEKIDAVQAQKGFFVARSFTRDAIAQAAKDKRIKLLKVNEHSIENIPMPFNFHFLLRDNMNTEVLFEERNDKKMPEKKKVNFDLENVVCELDDDPIDMVKYVQDWVKARVDSYLNTFPSSEKK